MSKQVLISLLAQGNTGTEILQILDNLAADAVSDTQEESIEFWCSLLCPLWLTLEGVYVIIVIDTVWQRFAGGCYRRVAALRL